MAEIDNPSFTFGIQDTMEMGMGNAELISDLLSPETSTEDPNKITPIIKEADPPAPEKKPDVAKGKEIVQTEEGKELTGQEIVSNFLGDNDIPEDETKEEKTESKEKDNPEDQTQDTVFSSLSKELLKLGVFTTEEGEEETPVTSPEEFLERFNIEKQRGAIEKVNTFIGQFGEDYQNAFDAIFVKGVNPKEYFGVYNNIVDFTNLDLTQEENQEAVVRQTLVEQGMEPEDIKTEIERIKNYGDLEAVSGKYHKVLVKKEAAKLQLIEQQAERDLQQKAEIRSQYIQNVQNVLQEHLKTKEFDGIPINPKLATELQDFLLVDKWKLPSGETISDFDRAILDMKRPENHEKKVKLALLLKILEKDPTLSTIQKTGLSKKSTELFGDLAKQVTDAKTGKPKQMLPPTWNL